MHLEAKKICFIDLAHATPPFNFYFIRNLINEFDVDIYCSETNYNHEFFIEIQKLPRVKLEARPISSSVQSSALKKIFYCFYLYFKIFKNRNEYSKVILNFPKIFILDLLSLIIFREKLFLMVHNVDRAQSLIEGCIHFLRTSLIKNKIFMSNAGIEQYLIWKNFKSPKEDKIYIAEHGLLAVKPGECDVKPNFARNRKIHKIAVLGNIKKYKGLEELAFLPNAMISKGYSFEIFGSCENNKVLQLLEQNGWSVHNKFLSAEELQLLINGDYVFILPHAQVTQSGLYYLLLHHRCHFVASDAGQHSMDFRNFQLEKLLFTHGNLSEVEEAIIYLEKNTDEISRKLEDLRANIVWGKIQYQHNRQRQIV